MMKWVVVAVVLVLGRGTVRADILVAGNPPLTTEVVSQTCDFLEWALATPFTQAQRDDATTMLVAVWNKHDTAAIQTVGAILAARTKLLAATPEVRARQQQQLGAALVAGLRKQSSDPASRWLLAIYNNATTSLAAGEPPLTEQMIDAYAELIGFMLGEVKQQKAVVPNAKDRAALAKQLAPRWAKLTADQRKAFAQVPFTWAAVRVQWAQTAEADRAAYRKQWAATLSPPKSDNTRSGDDAQTAMAAYRQALEATQMRQFVDMMTCNMASNFHCFKFNYGF